MADAFEQYLTTVANELTWLSDVPVFIGGMTIALFLDEVGRSQQRATKDVDCIVPRVTTYVAWSQLEAQLRAHSWTPCQHEGAPCVATSAHQESAFKLEAYRDRGREDPLLSQDFEDIAACSMATTSSKRA